METLYVVEQGAYLKKDGNTIKIIKQGSTLDIIPAQGLKKLILSGYVSLTGSVMNFLITNRIETVFVTPTGRFRARLMIDPHKHVALRKAQYKMLDNERFCVDTMKILVKGKLENMARFLLRRAGDYKDDSLRTVVAGLKALCKNLDSPLSKDSIRGIEGAGTRIYFSTFNRLIKNPAFEFNGRNRRPPKDPINALLSFVYTLLTNEVLSAIKICGMDPYMGSLHEISYGRPSLACDLVEEYRSDLGDRLVLSLINKKMVTPDDFVFKNEKQLTFIDEKEMKDSRPVEMKPYLLKAFISSYESMMTGSNSYRTIIQNQVYGFADYLKEPVEKRYKPYGGNL